MRMSAIAYVETVTALPPAARKALEFAKKIKKGELVDVEELAKAIGSSEGSITTKPISTVLSDYRFKGAYRGQRKTFFGHPDTIREVKEQLAAAKESRI